jgi:hypothetical protein
MNRQRKEELKQAQRQQGDRSQQHGQKPMPAQQSQQSGQVRQQGDQDGNQEAFRPIDTD